MTMEVSPHTGPPGTGGSSTLRYWMGTAPSRMEEPIEAVWDPRNSSASHSGMR